MPERSGVHLGSEQKQLRHQDLTQGGRLMMMEPFLLALSQLQQWKVLFRKRMLNDRHLCPRTEKSERNVPIKCYYYLPEHPPANTFKR